MIRFSMLARRTASSFKMAASVVIALLAIQIFLSNVHAKCSIDLNKDYNVSSPLFLNTKTLDIVYPERTSSKTLSFNSGEERLIHCYGGHIIQANVSTNVSSEVTKCVNGLTFSDPSKHTEFSFKQLICSKNPNPTTKESCRKRCRKCVTVNIGYQVTPSVFKKTIDLCYIPELATTTWSHAKISGAIGGYKNRESNTPAFSKGSYFGNVLMNQVYPKTYQQQMFMEIFKNDTALVDRYLPREGQKRNYFVKGHLVARADMFYHAEQYSTYFYVNVLPMWQSINNGNWKSIEATVRRTAGFEGNLDVWTGGLGVLNLSGKDIYLAKDKKNSSKLLVPAPKLLFKLVYNEVKNEALVFVTANDPYLSEKQVPEDYRICQEYKVCGQMFPQFEQRFEGFTYCCLYNDFMRNPIVRDIDIPVDFKNVAPLKLH